MKIEEVHVRKLQKRLNFTEEFHPLDSSLQKPLSQLKMELDDAPIFRYIYRNFKPKRHLEFGTWEGFGAVLCLEECNATVWTLNLLDGELDERGDFCYGHRIQEGETIPEWSNKRVYHTPSEGTIAFAQTDSLGYVGRLYREKRFNNRVCQIFCDSREWDISQYPADFFDSVLVDGGHSKDIVINDSRLALKLTRPGGLIFWHDYCPIEELKIEGSSIKGVQDAIIEQEQLLQKNLSDLFWINPSWILVGKKR